MTTLITLTLLCTSPDYLNFTRFFDKSPNLNKPNPCRRMQHFEKCGFRLVHYHNLRRRTALRQPFLLGEGRFLIQMIPYLFDHHGIFNTGDHLYGATAGAAGLDVDEDGRSY